MKLRLLCIVLFMACTRIAAAQQSDAVRVYFDCQFFCDMNFLRTEINYVSWVRDQTDAQVHVIGTRLGTGGGGSQYTFTFTGRKAFAGREDTLRYVSRSTDSDDQIRRGIARTLKLGLVPFIALTPGGEHLQISWDAGEANKTDSKPANDPWNYWVFTLGARANLEGESSQSFHNYNGNLSANRTTDAFKVRAGVHGNYRDSKFTYDPGTGTGDTTVISISKSYGLDVLGVKSRGEHWSAGVTAGANSATFGNISLGWRGGPALEYSVWPYKEATRRSLQMRYTIEVRSFDYREITIYGKTEEVHPAHEFEMELDLKQKFGSLGFSVQFSQYLHDTSFYNAEFSGNGNIKLFKGFSLDFYGNYERVHDQLSLSAAELTTEEVLLQQRQLKTDYRFYTGFGIRYSFGSIFNNVVNPRFGETGGGCC